MENYIQTLTYPPGMNKNHFHSQDMAQRTSDSCAEFQRRESSVPSFVRLKTNYCEGLL